MYIRNMKIEDYEAVYNLWLNTKGMGLNDIDDSKEGINKYLMRNPNTCFVVYEDNVLIGVILSGHDGRRGYIYHTAVDIRSRNKGIATLLVDSVLKAMRDEGINKVALVVFEHNELGNKFWEAQGFTIRDDLLYRNKAVIELKRIDT